MPTVSKPGRVVLMAVMVVAIWAVYAPVADFDFVLLDDEVYVTENPRVLAGLNTESARWALRTSTASNWHPVTWFSLMLDAQIGGADPRVFHLTNVVLHTLNALLLFHLLALTTGATWRSAAVAALFALHPLHVESVAWIAERKDVLSTLFWLLATWAYVHYARRPSWRRYAWVVAAFVLGLMSKPMLVTLPFALLLLDYWPLARRDARRLLLEKIPLFALSAASCWVTLWAQQHQVAAGVERFGLPLRALNAAISYAWYLVKTGWPVGLANPYGYDRDPAPLAVLASLLLVAGVSAVAWRLARRFPALPVGWLWYLGTLVPVIGIVQVGMQPRADRYTYVPLIGIFVMVAWGLPALLRGVVPVERNRRALIAVVAAVALVALALSTRAQLGHWRHSEALFARALSVNERNALAHHGMGMEMYRRGDVERSLRHYREAVRVDPSASFARANLAGVLRAGGHLEESVAQYRELLRQRPNSAEARANLGAALGDLGRYDEAVTELERALELDPGSTQAHKGAAFALARLGRNDEAIGHLEIAVELVPTDADAWLNLAIVQMQERRLDASERALAEALRLQPDFVNAHRRSAMLSALRGDVDGAVAALTRALQLDPQRADIRAELGRLQQLETADPSRVAGQR